MCGFSDARVAAIPRYHMSSELYASIAREVFPLTTYLHMSLMTEPFMTADFADRLMLAREYEVPYTRVVTNGTLLTPRIIGKILDSEITTLTISIDGGTKELYERIRVGAKFDLVLKNIELFKALRAGRGARLPMLQVNHVLMEENIDHVDEFLELLDVIRPEQVDVRTIEVMTFSSGAESRSEAFYEKVRSVRNRFTDYFASHGIEDCGFFRDREGMIDPPTASGERMTCRRPWDTLAIHANGDLLPCMSWTRPPIGNLARQSFRAITESAEMLKLRAEFEAVRPGVDCQHCTIKKTVARGMYDDFFHRMIDKSAVTETRF